eukprot:SAG11_NODE_3288_length_2551_cov_7.136215_3_plen_132_part_01
MHIFTPAACVDEQTMKKGASGAAAASAAAAGLAPQPKVRKKRVVKKDPNRVRSLPWNEDELGRFRQLLAEEGAGKWKEKAEKLGTGRTAKSLHTRWLRDEGRIIDRPRGAAAKQEALMQEAARAAGAAAAAA